MTYIAMSACGPSRQMPMLGLYIRFWPFATFCPLDGRRSLLGHCGRGWTCSSPGPVAIDTLQSQDGTVKEGLHRPRLSAIILSSRSPALILIAAPFSSRLSRYTPGSGSYGSAPTPGPAWNPSYSRSRAQT